VARLSPMERDASFPAAEAARRREPIFLGSTEAVAARYPRLGTLAAQPQQAALAVLPMLAHGEVVGVLRVGFGAPRRFDAAERAFLESLASQAALALERARGYEAEQRARAEASRIGALQEQLAAVVGHDLRTPLTAVSINAATLLRRGGLTPAQATSVGRIAQGTARMAGIIRDLLDFTRLRQGMALSLRPVPADLAELAGVAIQELEAAGAAESISLRAEGDVGILADAGRLTQVLSNLVGNALQHGAGSPVRVAITGSQREVRVDVCNGGPPIPAEVMPHVFEPFRRGDPVHGDPDHRGGSVGLGLYIVSEIVIAHGGRIEVRSTEAEGTCFSVRLPRQPPGFLDSPGARIV